jgi:AraC-like DNA-binding protein
VLTSIIGFWKKAHRMTVIHSKTNGTDGFSGWAIGVSGGQPQRDVDRTDNFAPIRFSTRELPMRDRLPMWREVFGRSVVRVEIEPASDQPFHAEAKLRMLPGLRVVEFTGSAMRFNRTSAMAATGDGSIGFVVNFSRRSMVSQRGRDTTLDVGDAIPIFTDQPAILTGLKHVGMLFPRSALASRVKNIEDAAKQPIPGDTEALRLLLGYLRGLPDQLALASPKLRRTIANHIHDLAGMALRPHDPVGADCMSAVVAARLHSALDLIARKFDKPGLSVATVARSQGVSPRYLQRLLEMTGMPFVERVNELRLQHAFALLIAENGCDLRISDVALQSGFSDISHFNRLFLARFGDTPSGVRRTEGKE